MDAKKYVAEHERLSQALNGEENLRSSVSAIREALEENNLYTMPLLAFDVVKFVLETIHLEKLTLPDRK